MSEASLAIKAARDDLEKICDIRVKASRLGMMQIQQKAEMADEAIGLAVSAMENILCALEVFDEQ